MQGLTQLAKLPLERDSLNSCEPWKFIEQWNVDLMLRIGFEECFIVFFRLDSEHRYLIVFLFCHQLADSDLDT